MHVQFRNNFHNKELSQLPAENRTHKGNYRSTELSFIRNVVNFQLMFACLSDVCQIRAPRSNQSATFNLHVICHLRGSMIILASKGTGYLGVPWPCAASGRRSRPRLSSSVYGLMSMTAFRCLSALSTAPCAVCPRPRLNSCRSPPAAVERQLSFLSSLD